MNGGDGEPAKIVPLGGAHDLYEGNNGKKNDLDDDIIMENSDDTKQIEAEIEKLERELERILAQGRTGDTKQQVMLKYWETIVRDLADDTTGKQSEVTRSDKKN